MGDNKFFLKACYNNRVNEGIIQCLLEYFPAAASATIENGWSPLHYACCNKHVTLNIIQLFVDAAPDFIRRVNSHGRMPLHYLCKTKALDEAAALEILELLIEKQSGMLIMVAIFQFIMGDRQDHLTFVVCSSNYILDLSE